ncbi:hypothetical protein SAMN06295933_3021 [Desulfovibrio gilichinskyi]|uniref:Uncharacterized protein n=1 Tax=Desulfovibrio gilichinskyi TaxID=1519643 RepID=A0A1X7EIS5_9BACT|nr:hypothetical protein SAMN06295933_3021 [Desulfovibrio gilichinskyi]
MEINSIVLCSILVFVVGVCSWALWDDKREKAHKRKENRRQRTPQKPFGI